MASDRAIQSPLLQAKADDAGFVKVAKITPRTMLIDVVTGVLAPLPVVPLIAVVDASIINSVNGDRTPVMQGMREGFKMIFTQPHKYVTSPRWMKISGLCWMVYGGTYAAANLAYSYIDAHKLSGLNASLLKVSTSSSFNIGLTLVKDVMLVGIIAELAKEAGNTSGPAKKGYVPMRSRLCFITRDVMTMIAAFVLSKTFGEWIARRTEGWLTERQALFAATLTLPVMIQPFSTVLHLYALNYAKDQTLHGDRMIASMRSNYFAATLSRMTRILPAVGMGNNLRAELRNYTYRTAEARRWI